MPIDLLPPPPSPRRKRTIERITVIHDGLMRGTHGDLENPAGSCLPELRAARVDRRARRMRLRKLRGWR